MKLRSRRRVREPLAGALVALLTVCCGSANRRPPAAPTGRAPTGRYELCVDPTASPPVATALPPCRATDSHYGFVIGATGAFDLIPEPLGCTAELLAGALVLHCPAGHSLQATWRPNADGSVTTDLLDRLEGDRNPGPAT